MYRLQTYLFMKERKNNHEKRTTMKKTSEKSDQKKSDQKTIMSKSNYQKTNHENGKCGGFRRGIPRLIFFAQNWQKNAPAYPAN